MRYISRAFGVIRSENAAKPRSQSSRFTRDYLVSLPIVESAADYGCGKARYLPEMISRSHKLSLVDSSTQLNRVQQIEGSAASLVDVLSSRNDVNCLSTKDFIECGGAFDRVFCLNVLSAVPFPTIRTAIADRIRHSLRQGGVCVASHQYRNSDFGKMKASQKHERYGDGMLMHSLRGPSFYSLMSRDDFIGIWEAVGLQCKSYRLNEGSIFLELTTQPGA